MVTTVENYHVAKSLPIATVQRVKHSCDTDAVASAYELGIQKVFFINFFTDLIDIWRLEHIELIGSVQGAKMNEKSTSDGSVFASAKVIVILMIRSVDLNILSTFMLSYTSENYF